jgi:ABC-type lipoprotein export system ATPase subunit
MGFIFQSFFVQTSQTCFENVSLPLEILGVPVEEREALVDEALKAVGLFDKKMVYAHDLSGGQKQRLAVARAIVNRPHILFADEPTGNLDSLTGKAIEDLLFWCNRMYKITLIIVTHDRDLAAKCDMQITIRDGKVASITDKGRIIPVPGKAVVEQALAEVAKEEHEASASKKPEHVQHHLAVRALEHQSENIAVHHLHHDHEVKS